MINTYFLNHEFFKKIMVLEKNREDLRFLELSYFFKIW